MVMHPYPPVLLLFSFACPLVTSNKSEPVQSYSVRPGCIKEAAARFLAGEAAPVEGVTLLGRWHKADGSGGFVLHESDSPEAITDR